MNALNRDIPYKSYGKSRQSTKLDHVWMVNGRPKWHIFFTWSKLKYNRNYSLILITSNCSRVQNELCFAFKICYKNRNLLNWQHIKWDMLKQSIKHRLDSSNLTFLHAYNLRPNHCNSLFVSQNTYIDWFNICSFSTLKSQP